MAQNDVTERLKLMLNQVGAVELTTRVRSTLESRASGQRHGPTLDVRAVTPEAAYAKAGVEALDVLQRGGKLDFDKRFALEAIVMPLYRPVVDVRDDYIVVDQLQDTWQDLGSESRRDWTRDRIRAVGRINVPNLLYAGTAFVVGPTLLMTNRHVASIFAQGLGNKVDFQSGQTASIGFYHEKGSSKTESLKVEKVVMIHPYWDMALLEVSGLSPDRKPLRLSTLDPSTLKDRKVVVVGYPGYDPSDDQEFQRVQERIFRGTYYVKRFQPGNLRVRDEVESFGRMISAVTHDCSTLGGNSGSAVIDIESGDVLGLHFMGAYLRANYAVSTFDLAQDNRVASTLASAGVQFEGRVDSSGDLYGLVHSAWKVSDSAKNAELQQVAESGSNLQVVTTPMPPQDSGAMVAAVRTNSATFSIPLQVSVSIGTAVMTIDGAPSKIAAPTILPTQEGQFGTSPPAAKMAIFERDALTSEPFTWKSALCLALASKLAYESDAAVINTTKVNWNFDTCEFIDIDDNQCFVAMTDTFAMVSFRGTESRGDWFYNANVPGRTRDYGVVHRGFLGAFQAVEYRLQKALSQLNGRRLLVTGHSLGGAIATIMAAEWQRTMPPTWVVTFGQPAVCRGESKMFMRINYAGRFFRFVNDDDVVARVPPRYEHVGRLLHFDAKGNLQNRQKLPKEKGAVTETLELESLDQGPAMMTEVEYRSLQSLAIGQFSQSAQPGQESLAARQEGLLPSVRDHSMDKYIAKILAMATT
jgi:V8-like Glu-specific endopeptidase